MMMVVFPPWQLLQIKLLCSLYQYTRPECGTSLLYKFTNAPTPASHFAGQGAFSSALILI